MEVSFVSRPSVAARNESSVVALAKASMHKAAKAWLMTKRAGSQLLLPSAEDSKSFRSNSGRSCSLSSSSLRVPSFRASSLRGDVLEVSSSFREESLLIHEFNPVGSVAVKEKQSFLAKAVRKISRIGRKKSKNASAGNSEWEAPSRLAVFGSRGGNGGEDFEEPSMSFRAAGTVACGVAGYGMAVGLEKISKNGSDQRGFDGELGDIGVGNVGGSSGGGDGGGGGAGGGGNGNGDNFRVDVDNLLASGDEEELQQTSGVPRHLAGPFASVNLPAQPAFQSFPGRSPNESESQSIFRRQQDNFEPLEAKNETSISPASLGRSSPERSLPTVLPPSELHPDGADSSFPDQSDIPQSVGDGGSRDSEQERASQSPVVSGLETSGKQGQQEEKRSDFFDWIAELLHPVTHGGKPNPHAPTAYSEHERNIIVEQAAAHVMKLILEGTGDEGLAKKAETGALRRLQRETFSDLLKIRERLDKIEVHTGLRGLKNFGISSGLAKTRLTGEVNAGAAVVLLKDSSSRQSRSALEQAGMLTGLEVKFRFETSFRERDKLVTECVAGQSSEVGGIATFGGPISLRKVAYTAEINDRVNISVAPFGGDVNDMLQSINPSQDIGLTSFTSYGPALYSHCKGSGIGATFKGTQSAWSILQYLGGWENSFSGFESANSGAPLCLSTLAQAIAVPADFMACSVSVLNRFWPSPPLPSNHGLHWSEMGPLVLSKTQSPSSTSLRTSNGSVANGQLVNWSTSELDSGVLEAQGAAMQSFSLAVEADLGPVNVGGWAQLDRTDWLPEKQLQWALSVAKSAGAKVGGGVRIGQSSPDFWSSSPIDDENPSGDAGQSQLQVEAFLRLNCAQGFVLQPGLLYVLNKQSRTPALMLRSSWNL